MELMTPEEIEECKQDMRDIGERIRNGDLELAKEMLASIDERVLTEQPELTPREQGDLLLQELSNSRK